MKILNIGAGDRPLSTQALGMTHGFIINYDPGLELDRVEQYAFRHLSGGRIFFNYFEEDVKPDDVFYFGSMEALKSYFRDNSFDMLLSISPYGFHVINNKTDPFLEMSGKVLAIGNSRNAWLDARFTGDDVPGLFAPGLIRNYSTYTIPDTHDDPCKVISDRIKAEYISFTTSQAQGHALRPTPLEVVKAFTKNNV